MEPLEAGDPRQVGRFEIIARLGAGGMGRVYLARSASGEQFALKMIHQFLSDDVQFRRRFEREVMAAQRVTGENTAALVDADPDARPPWMAVEFVDGPTLSEMVEHGGPLTLVSCARLASGMAQALISIHAAGLVHRDLKPSNVLMGAAGARLIDFGIAQATGASSLTMTGLVTGSAGFMSPEQAQAEHVTEASDVFALGTVLFFAATGQKPFGEGSMISVTYRVVHADPNLSGIRDDGLRELIADCLMKDPRARPTPWEIYERCPGIADGTWNIGRTNRPPSAFSSGSTIETEIPLQPLPPPPPRMSAPIPHQQPMGMPSRSQARRDVRGAGRSEGLRQSILKPWLVAPVAIVLLAAGTAVAVSLGGGDTPKPSDTSSSEVTEEATDPDETSVPVVDPEDDRPREDAEPTRKTRPTTTKARRTPSPTKSASVDGKPSPTSTDPGKPSASPTPDPKPPNSPSPSPSLSPEPEPTPTPSPTPVVVVP